MAKTQKPAAHGQSRKELTRDKILNAATLEEVPPCLSAINMKAIAERAGVSRQTAYRHFQDRETLVEQLTEWLSDRLGEIHSGIELESFRSVNPDGPLPSYYKEKIENGVFSESYLRFFFCSLMEGDIRENPYVKEQTEYYQNGKAQGILRPEMDEEVVAMIVTLCVWLGPYLFTRGEKSVEAREEMLVRYFKTYRQLLHNGMYKKND